jgi:hypothetical protein
MLATLLRVKKSEEVAETILPEVSRVNVPDNEAGLLRVRLPEGLSMVMELKLSGPTRFEENPWAPVPLNLMVLVPKLMATVLLFARSPPML